MEELYRGTCSSWRCYHSPLKFFGSLWFNLFPMYAITVSYMQITRWLRGEITCQVANCQEWRFLHQHKHLKIHCNENIDFFVRLSIIALPCIKIPPCFSQNTKWTCSFWKLATMSVLDVAVVGWLACWKAIEKNIFYKSKQIVTNLVSPWPWSSSDNRMIWQNLVHTLLVDLYPST